MDAYFFEQVDQAGQGRRHMDAYLAEQQRIRDVTRIAELEGQLDNMTRKLSEIGLALERLGLRMENGTLIMTPDSEAKEGPPPIEPAPDHRALIEEALLYAQREIQRAITVLRHHEGAPASPQSADRSSGTARL